MTTSVESIAAKQVAPMPRRGPGPWRVALLGAGYIAEWHAKAIRMVEGVNLVAVCDKAISRAQAYAGAFGIPHAYGSAAEMLKSERLDAVHVLLPPDLHFAAAMEVLDAGVHVFLEKPMCTRAEDCEALAQRAAKDGLRVGIGHNFLFAGVYEQLRRDVREGKLGRIDQVTIDWSRELGQISGGPFDIWMLREPQNVMLEIGPHSVAHLLDLLGQPEQMQVRASNPVELPTGVPFYRRWQVDAFAGKTAATLRWSFVPGFAEHTIHVRGRLGSAIADLERNTYSLRRHTPKDDDLDRYAMIRDEAKSLRTQGWRNLRNYVLSKFKLSRQGSAYASSIAGATAAFYASIGGEMDHRVSPELGREVIAICQEIGRLAAIPPRPSQPAQRAENAVIPDAVAAPRILVLGATGFIGRELVRQLIAQGRGVRVLVRSASKLPPDLRTPLVEVVRGDLANELDLAAAFSGIDCVYHLARAMVKTWSDYQKHDIELTKRIAEHCLGGAVKRLIYTGTIDSYYAGAGAGTITESTPLDPRVHRRNLYARAKAVSEEMLIQMHREQKLPVVIVRPGIVIGRGGSPFHWGVGMWRYGSICQLWGDGTNRLPFVLVEDVARGLVAAMDTQEIDGQSFNLVGDPCLSGQEYLDELERFAGIKLMRHPTPIWKFYLGDMFKWVIKVLVRHPERRRPSYHDWESRTQRAIFDCSQTKQQLNWLPVTDRNEIIRCGIQIPISEVVN
ncbi:MAG: NAD-dependent epimerase/dehydratase family protein [Tepidisphaeraceae bacterium]|jgi:predicted dehydrogenase/nucleoside-diphosphate-sugar epimerase